MISEPSSSTRSSPLSSAFPTFLCIVLWIILVGVGWEPFLFFMHSFWHKTGPHNVYRTTRVAALLLHAQNGVKSSDTRASRILRVRGQSAPTYLLIYIPCLPITQKRLKVRDAVSRVCRSGENPSWRNLYRLAQGTCLRTLSSSCWAMPVSCAGCVVAWFCLKPQGSEQCLL